MPIAARPDWLGIPQHFAGGLLLALAVAVVARSRGVSPWLSFALAIGAASTAEIVVELVEYPLRYSGTGEHPYYDTLADMANTLVGSVVGAAAGVWWAGRRRRRKR